MSDLANKKPPSLVALSTLFVLFWLVVAAFPFLWTMWGSFKVEGDFFSRADWMNAITGPVTERQHGGPFTLDGYRGAWVEQEFWRAVVNTGIVVFFTVVISLTLGTLGGYALARSGFKYTFWLLMAALVFRAMPHVTLVSGYLLPFFQMNIWGYLPTTIIVLVAINQPFTLWMLHSFFLSIPKDLDEAARGVIQIKDLVLGAQIAENATLEEWKERPSQFEVPRSELVAKVRDILKAQS